MLEDRILSLNLKVYFDNQPVDVKAKKTQTVDELIAQVLKEHGIDSKYRTE